MDQMFASTTNLPGINELLSTLDGNNKVPSSVMSPLASTFGSAMKDASMTPNAGMNSYMMGMMNAMMWMQMYQMKGMKFQFPQVPSPVVPECNPPFEPVKIKKEPVAQKQIIIDLEEEDSVSSASSTPPSSPTPAPISQQHSNSAKTFPNYEFHVQGGRTDQKGQEWVYRYCVLRKTGACPARIQHIRSCVNVSEWTFLDKHNHPPPESRKRKHMDPKLRLDLENALASGKSTLDAHTDAVETLTAEGREDEIPLYKTVSNMNYKVHRITGDVISNLQDKCKGALRWSQTNPMTLFILMTDFGQEVLENYGSVLFTDTTFDICVGKLKLTTLMANIGTVGVPTAFALSDTTDQITYQRIFAAVKDECRGKLNPEAVLTDYDNALRSAVRCTWPLATTYGDFFHFQQANCKSFKAQKGKTSEQVSELMRDLRTVWMTIPEHNFNEALKIFKRKYTEKGETKFVTYFEHTWEHMFPPSQWALWGRDEDSYPSGTGNLEGWHNKLQNHRVKKDNIALENLVEILLKEAKYMEQIIRVDHLYNERESKSRRVSFKEIHTKSKDASHKSKEKKPKKELTNPCSKCKSRPGNQKCIAKCCRKCCLQTDTYCTESDHQRKKDPESKRIRFVIGAPAKPEIVELIAKSISEGKGSQKLFIVYKGQNESSVGADGKPRPIIPISWLEGQSKFLATCLLSNLDKTFYVNRIEKASVKEDDTENRNDVSSETNPL